MLSAVSPLQVCDVGLVSRKILFFMVPMTTKEQQTLMHAVQRSAVSELVSMWVL